MKSRYLTPGIFAIVLVISSFLLNLEAAAWGSTGHRAIAEIAYQQLENKTKKKIAAILSDDYLPLFANYADEVRSEKDNPLGKVPHYVNMELDESYESAVKNDHGDLVTVFNEMVETIKDAESSNEEKAVALKFIIHLVGDAQQPMHVGLPEDLGGNRVQVKWFRESTNLHSLWDSGLIEHSRLSYTELARFVGKPDKSEMAALRNVSVVDWINETHVQTRKIYEGLGDKNYRYEYYYEFSPLLFRQIRTAGYRLGNFLNVLMKEI